MSDGSLKSLLEFLWGNRFLGDSALFARTGEPVSVLSPGELVRDGGPTFRGCELQIGLTQLRGDVVVQAQASDWERQRCLCDERYENVVLQVVGTTDGVALDKRGELIPCLQLPISEDLVRVLKNLPGPVCQGCVRAIPDVKLTEAMTRLLFERLERKWSDIMAIYREVGEDWIETFHVMLFRTIGLNANKEAFVALARRLPHGLLCRERETPQGIEALLFGVAGHLQVEYPDAYTSNLQRIFRELQRKYANEVICLNDWSESGIRPYNYPEIRISQLVKLLESRDFSFSRIRACKSLQEIRDLFDVQLDGYWNDHFVLSQPTACVGRPKSLGRNSVTILLINLVVPMLFAYGKQTGDETATDRIVELLENSQAEENVFTREWMRSGISIPNAFFSQAFIQLSTEYCRKLRCTECFVGIKELKKAVKYH